MVICTVVLWGKVIFIIFLLDVRSGLFFIGLDIGFVFFFSFLVFRICCNIVSYWLMRFRRRWLWWWFIILRCWLEIFVVYRVWYREISICFIFLLYVDFRFSSLDRNDLIVFRVRNFFWSFMCFGNNWYGFDLIVELLRLESIRFVGICMCKYFWVNRFWRFLNMGFFCSRLR